MLGVPTLVGMRLRQAFAIALVGVLAASTGCGSGSAGGCTVTWRGGQGVWSDTVRWQPARVPVASDHVCIPVGRAIIDHGSWHIASVRGHALAITGGAIEVWDRRRSSQLASLRLAHGILDGSARLVVTHELVWGEGGVMEGDGLTVIDPKATATLGFGHGYGQLARNLANYGRLTLDSGSLYGDYGATLGNAGTMILRSGSHDPRKKVGLLPNQGLPPCLANTGLVRKIGALHTTLGFDTNNTGKVDAAGGELKVTGGFRGCPLPV